MTLTQQKNFKKELSLERQEGSKKEPNQESHVATVLSVGHCHSISWIPIESVQILYFESNMLSCKVRFAFFRDDENFTSNLSCFIKSCRAYCAYYIY